MNVALNKTDNLNGIISIVIEKDDYQGKVDKTLADYRRRANIPGFRQGKVPMPVIKKMYGKSTLVEEVNTLVSKKLFDYIKASELDILGEPLFHPQKDKVVDFDKDETFEFCFDIAFAPEMPTTFSKEDHLPWYNVKIEDDLVQKQIDEYKRTLGTYKQVEEPAVDTDLIKGEITELENGSAKEGGIVVENGIIMPSYIKDEEIKGRFVGTKVGEVVTFNPKVAYDGHEAEISSLLHIEKTAVSELNSEFSFEVKEVTRYEEPEMGKELYDKIFGKDNEVNTEEEFRTKMVELFSGQFIPAVEDLFMESFRKMVVEKLKDLEMPEAFLQRWLLEAKKIDEEKLETDFPKILEDFKYYFAKEKIIKDQNFKVEPEELKSLAKEVTKAQFAQYGMANMPDEMLENYSQNMLNNKETFDNINERIKEKKIAEYVKTIVTIDYSDIMSEDFKVLMDKEFARNQKPEVEEEHPVEE